MPFSINVIYLLILIAIAICFIVILNAMQKFVLKHLSVTLFQQNAPELYQEMLKSKRLRLVLRRSTLTLLELEGYYYIRDEDRAQQTATILENMKLSSSEQFTFYQKALCFSVSLGKVNDSTEYLQKLENLLKNQTNPKFIAILEDARLLVGVYINKDVSLLPELERLEKQQTGTQKGLTQYRMAKLYYYKGDVERTVAILKQSERNLEGTVWYPLVQQALVDNSELEVK